MSRLKLILSILLMLFLLLVAIFLPSKLREQKETPDPEAQEEAATQEETTQPEELTEMDFLSFEELSQFFSSAQTASLKEQFPLYLTLIGGQTLHRQNICRMKPGIRIPPQLNCIFSCPMDSTLPVSMTP